MSSSQELLAPKSRLSRVEVTKLPPIESDVRRVITEFHNNADLGFHNAIAVQVAEPQAGGEVVLGNHWEPYRELFYVTEGMMSRLILEDVDTKAQKIYHDLGAGSRILLPERVAHTLIFEHNATLLAMRERPFVAEEAIHYPLYTSRNNTE